MTNEELQAETQRLMNMSDSLVNANRGDATGPGATLLGHALSGCFALLFAAIPAGISSFFVELQSTILVFCSMIVFYGCTEISNAVISQSNAHVKMLDNIDALRPVLVDLGNRIQYSSNPSQE